MHTMWPGLFMNLKTFLITGCLILALSFQLHADTETIRPDGDGNYSGWTDLPSANFDWQKVDEPDPPNDGDYVYTSTDNQRESFTFGDPQAITGDDNIDSIRVYCRAKEFDDANQCPFLRISATDYDHGTCWALTQSYANYFVVWTADPSDEQAFTLGDLNDIEAGTKGFNCGFFDDTYCSQFWIVIYFTPSAEEGRNPLLLKTKQRG